MQTFYFSASMSYTYCMAPSKVRNFYVFEDLYLPKNNISTLYINNTEKAVLM